MESQNYKAMKTYSKTTPEIKLKKKNGQILAAQIKTSKDAADYFRALFDAEQLEVREQAMAIYLNSANNTIGYYLVSIGGISATLMDTRLVMRAGIECGATSLILCHNHPSGQLKVSEADKSITKKVKEAGNILDIRLLDHIILTADNYTSMADDGEI
jgi:DNA repair protein RadC